ncbi:MAG: aldehyde ferredoxin oxidoreductase family protein [Anaerolineae bacterium]
MTATFGYTGKILWIDLTTQTSHLEPRDAGFWRRYVGGGLAATALLLEETPPGIDPLGPDNLLIFASSVVAGHDGAGLARFTTCAKSPLTGGIGETRTEGPWGGALKGCGADILVFTGRSEEPVTVEVADGAATFHNAKALWGKTVGETVDALEEELGGDLHVAAIGPAGENLVRFASIVTERTYQASRMGMGAVMGAKRLKAVILRGGKRPPVYDAAAMHRLTADFRQRMLENDLSTWQYEPPGFSCWIYLHGLDAALDVNNYRQSTFDRLQGYREDEFLARSIQELGCPGCPNHCIKAIHPNDAEDLDPRASGIHQEVTGTMGPNIGVGDLDTVLRANNLCNQYGMDPTSLGFTISFAMELSERGLLPEEELHFGDGAGALRTAEQIARRQGLGDLLAEGTRRAAAQIGGEAPRYAMQVKGLEMVPFEPRSQTNLAMGYAVAPIGPRYDICEHDWDFDTEVGWSHTLDLSRTLGILERIPMGMIGPEKVRNFKALHILWSAADALDLCIFAIAPTRLLSLRQMTEMVRAATGWETSSYELMRIGERRLHLMRWYNLREGLTATDDRLPDRFYEEPIASGPREGDVIDREAFEAAIATFYAMMGWDEEGKPTPATLYDCGLDWVLEEV